MYSVKKFLILFLIFNTTLAVAANSRQNADMVVMVSPDYFQYNPETARTNTFQHDLSKPNINALAQQAYQTMVKTLEKNDITVISLASVANKITPDAVFPNNWFTVHKVSGGSVLVIYPMFDKNRRAEKQIDNLISELKAHQVHITKIIDLSHYEKNNLALEGTGSLVLDRINDECGNTFRCDCRESN